MDRAKFFAALRKSNSGVFGTSLKQPQVEGVEAILDECHAQGADLGQAAYILATGYGETGGGMQPRRENMNYSAQRIPQVFGAPRRQGVPVSKLAGNPQLLANTVYGGPWGRKHLGNVEPNDGWNFRGFGIGQWTGRRNVEKIAKVTGLDVIRNPALLNDLETNAELLVKWMLLGGATGRRLPEFVKGDKRDYLGARKVWGGVDASKYARFAVSFEEALREAGYSADDVFTPPPPDVEPIAHPDPEEQPQGWLAAIVALLMKVLGK